MKKYDFVVLGGGISGLSFAKKVSEKGKSVLILEKEDIIGGLSRTIKYKDFYLDFCAHRFHTKNEELMREIKSLSTLKMYEHQKLSRIYMFNKYLKYPFEMQNLLRAMPITKSVASGISFLTNLLYKNVKKDDIKSYKDWFVHYYGMELYKVMCEPYTSKIWKMDPSKLSADWADQRFQGENLKKLTKRILKKMLTLNFSKYSLEDDELAPDGGLFYYPKKGIQELPDAIKYEIKKNHGEIACNAEIKKIRTNKKEIDFKLNGKINCVKYDNLISTIPLHTYYNLQNNKNLDVEKTLKSLDYLDIVFVYLFIDKANISRDHWLYFPDPNIIFNRAVEFSNWSDEMCPKGKTSVCFDITAKKQGKIWNMSDEDLIKKTINDAKKTKYLSNENIFDSLVIRIKNAYPVYDLQYKTKLTKIVNHFEQNNTYLLGRTGIFRYNNADNSMEMGIELAKNFIENKKEKSISEYKIKKTSY